MTIAKPIPRGSASRLIAAGLAAGDAKTIERVARAIDNAEGSARQAGKTLSCDEQTIRRWRAQFPAIELAMAKRRCRLDGTPENVDALLYATLATLYPKKEQSDAPR